MNQLLQEHLDIEPKIIKAKYDNTSVTINTPDYGDDIAEVDTYFNIVGIFDIFVQEVKETLPIVFNYQVKLMKTENTTYDKGKVVINYKAGEVIVVANTKQSEVGISGFMKLLNSRADFVKDPSVLLSLLTEKLSDIDLVHFEVIISNMVRSKDDITKLGRHCKQSEQTVIYGNLKLASTDSVLSSLAFRDINKSIENGLVHSYSNKPNIIDSMIASNL